MLKKILFSLLISAALLPVMTHAAEDFSAMNPTVKITSYRKLYTDNVLAYGSGSGTVITSDGLMVTNNHVIFDENEYRPLDAFEVCITFQASEEPVCKYTANLVANSLDLDLALLKLNSKDIFGNTIPPLKTLSYQSGVNTKEQDRVQVLGYPGSGGDTITITQGQVSGFDVYNNATYFKTDTDIDHGNSGGTVLDSQGNYIGIPTFIRSYAENVGYFLDIRDAAPWINAHRNDSVRLEEAANNLLTAHLTKISKANETLTFQNDRYPYYEVKVPKGWKFLQINPDSLYAELKEVNNQVAFSIYTSLYQYPIDQGYKDELDKQLSKVKSRYPDYKKEDVTFAGQKSWKISYSGYSAQYVSYYIFYGYSLINLNYNLEKDKQDKELKALEPVINSFKFLKSPENNPDLPATLTFEEPPFSLTASGDFRIQKNSSLDSSTLLAEAVQEGNYKGSFQVHYQKTPKDQLSLSESDRLDEIVKDVTSSNSKLIFKNDQVALDGLKGYLYTTEYEGSDFQEIHKNLNLTLVDGDYEFTIQYDDLTENFDKNLPLIRDMLNSFAFEGGNPELKGKHDYGALGETFSDIQYHRFGSAIGSLAEKGVVSGYSDGSFKPEARVTRAEALKIILESKNHLEKKKDLGKEVDFKKFNQSSFGDVRTGDWFLNYVSYAAKKGIVSGVTKNRFKPSDSVTLAEALKMLFKVYEIPIWNGETNPWTKKYMDKGFDLGLIPRGWDNANAPLTRAELAYLVDELYSQAKY